MSSWILASLACGDPGEQRPTGACLLNSDGGPVYESQLNHAFGPPDHQTLVDGGVIWEWDEPTDGGLPIAAVMQSGCATNWAQGLVTPH